MKRMSIPLHDAAIAYDTCVQGIVNPTERSIYTVNRPGIITAGSAFDMVSGSATWASLPRVPRGNPGTAITGTLTKKHLMDLYTDHMVAAGGAPRQIYDDILTAAKDICPSCGGLGQASTLDHFLPKANFPAYAVTPRNLVPSCKDCNTGKNASFGAAVHQQTLHPYLDQDHFFSERWIVASVQRSNPVLITFECRPPIHWNWTDQNRALSHFISYRIPSRFSVQAGGEVTKVIELRTKSLRRLPPEDFQEFLQDNADTTDFVLNGWSRTMYLALANTDWFIRTDFRVPNWHLLPPP